MSLFTPTLYLTTIDDISVAMLHRLNIKAVFVDIDCTLASQDSNVPFDNVREWLSDIKNANIEIVLFSNNFNARVSTFARQFKLPFVSFAAKPLSVALFRAKRRLTDKNIRYRECAVIGDQLFTDILCAKLGGAKSILLDPHTDVSYNFSFFRDNIEKPFRDKLKKNDTSCFK